MEIWSTGFATQDEDHDLVWRLALVLDFSAPCVQVHPSLMSGGVEILAYLDGIFL